MEIDHLTEEQRKLWSRVEALWKLTITRSTAAARDALHPQYTGWVTGQAHPHDREAAVASVDPSSPRVTGYELRPLAITVFDGIVGVVHYMYSADIDASSNGLKKISGRWTEVYLQRDGEWLMIAVSGGPDGER
jgi:hypothetical protein